MSRYYGCFLTSFSPAHIDSPPKGIRVTCLDEGIQKEKKPFGEKVGGAPCAISHEKKVRRVRKP
jgi:hypothetical protein